MTKLLTLFFILIPAFVFAQFSGRTGDSTVYKLGGRPVKGYKALTLSFDPAQMGNPAYSASAAACSSQMRAWALSRPGSTG